MRKKELKKNDGFTLIEFLIYSVIVSFMMGALVLSSANIMMARTKVNIIQEVNHNAKMAMNSMINAIREAESIIAVGPGYLSLENRLALNSPVIFEIVDDVLIMTEGSHDAVFITSETVRVVGLEFTDLSFSEGGTVKIILTIEYNNISQREEYDFESTFYASENIRR